MKYAFVPLAIQDKNSPCQWTRLTEIACVYLQEQNKHGLATCDNPLTLSLSFFLSLPIPLSLTFTSKNIENALNSNF